MAELSKRFSIIESIDEEGNITHTTEYLEYDDKGKQTVCESGSFTLAEDETLRTWYDHATDHLEEDEAVVTE